MLCATWYLREGGRLANCGFRNVHSEEVGNNHSFFMCVGHQGTSSEERGKRGTITDFSYLRGHSREGQNWPAIGLREGKFHLDIQKAITQGDRGISFFGGCSKLNQKRPYATWPKFRPRPHSKVSPGLSRGLGQMPPEALSDLHYYIIL